MNPQKNQAADASPLLRDLQAEVATESAPLLQFMVRHGGAIAGIVALFVLVLAGTGVWRWHAASRDAAAREELAHIVLQTQGAEQLRALTAMASDAPKGVRSAVELALGQSALEHGDPDAAAAAFAKAAEDAKGALGLAASLNQAGALLKANKPAEALPLLQGLLHNLPAEFPAPQLTQLTAEAAEAAGQKEEAARLYLSLAETAPGVDSDYFRARAAALAPALAQPQAAPEHSD